MCGLQERGAVAALSRRRATPPGSLRSAGPRRLAVGLVTAGLVVTADQVTKTLAVDRLSGPPTHLFGPFGLSLGYNSGVAFSLFTRATPLIAALAAVLVVVLSWLAFRARSGGVALSVGLVLGGALGNLCDRVFRSHHGSVVDFITLTHWPTFNVADACITIGGIALVVAQLRHGIVDPSAPSADDGREG